MKKLLVSAFFVLIFLFSLPLGLVSADLPNRPSSYVSDTAGVLDGRTRLELESLLVDLKRKTSAEVAVVTVSSLDGRDIEGVAVDLYKKWGLGEKGKDNGVLFLIAPKDRKVRIETGYGIEGIIPDALAGRFINEAILPSFRAGKMSDGVKLGTMLIAQTIAQDAKVTLSGATPHTSRRPVRRRKKTLLEKLLSLALLIIMIPILIRHPWLIFFLLSSGRGGSRGGGGFGGGFGGFGGGMSGGGGASGGW